MSVVQAALLKQSKERSGSLKSALPSLRRSASTFTTSSGTRTRECYRLALCKHTASLECDMRIACKQPGTSLLVNQVHQCAAITCEAVGHEIFANFTTGRHGNKFALPVVAVEMHATAQQQQPVCQQVQQMPLRCLVTAAPPVTSQSSRLRLTLH